MDFNKKIGSGGGITLPAALRRDLGIDSGEKINIRVEENGEIVLKRIIGACVFCQSDEKVKLYRGRYICQACCEAIGRLEGGV